MYSSKLANSIRERAADRCEYCLMHQALQGATFHIEHIVPRCEGGATELQNLALACPSCNLHKADRTEVVDPFTGMTVRLFHPVEQAWSVHFHFVGDKIEG